MMGFPKPESRKRIKGRKDRAEATIKKLVRAACVLRDGHCRLMHAEVHRFTVEFPEIPVSDYDFHVCGSISEWAHFGDKRRSRTRGQAAEIRHTTAGSLMLCKTAHEAYDAGRLKITALTRRGCDGRLKFRMKT